MSIIPHEMCEKYNYAFRIILFLGKASLATEVTHGMAVWPMAWPRGSPPVFSFLILFLSYVGVLLLFWVICISRDLFSIGFSKKP